MGGESVKQSLLYSNNKKKFVRSARLINLVLVQSLKLSKLELARLVLGWETSSFVLSSYPAKFFPGIFIFLASVRDVLGKISEKIWLGTDGG